MDDRDIYFMKEALEEAYRAYELEDVPIGCVIVKDNQIIARGYNRKEVDGVATYHAEVLAINEACRKLKTWYLDECTLYTTVEPCMMCTGAIIQARISKIVYGTDNQAFGYLRKLDNSKVEVKSGILKYECMSILSEFFRGRR